MALSEPELQKKILGLIANKKLCSKALKDLACPHGHSHPRHSVTQGGGMPPTYRVWCSQEGCDWEFQHTQLITRSAQNENRVST
jgi:hypothetical protein